MILGWNLPLRKTNHEPTTTEKKTTPQDHPIKMSHCHMFKSPPPVSQLYYYETLHTLFHTKKFNQTMIYEKVKTQPFHGPFSGIKRSVIVVL